MSYRVGPKTTLIQTPKALGCSKMSPKSITARGMRRCAHPVFPCICWPWDSFSPSASHGWQFPSQTSAPSHAAIQQLHACCCHKKGSGDLPMWPAKGATNLQRTVLPKCVTAKEVRLVHQEQPRRSDFADQWFLDTRNDGRKNNMHIKLSQCRIQLSWNFAAVNCSKLTCISHVIEGNRDSFKFAVNITSNETSRNYIFAS